MVSVSAFLSKYAYHESGLASLWTTGRDAWLIIFARCCRMFAYGASSLILALFFNELHVSDARIGLFLTLTLVGDVVLSLAIALVADRIGRRRTLQFGALLMILSGATFSLSDNYWVLLPAAVVGVLSATGGDTGPFRAIEESTLSELTTPATRSDVLSWYITTAAVGSACGVAAAGRMIESLKDRDGWTLLEAYHACFGLYSLMGVIASLAAFSLSRKCELKPAAITKEHETGEAAEGLLTNQELSPVDDSHHALDGVEEEPKPPPNASSKIARISKETLSIMYALWFLLMVDSLADGMVSMSLTTYYVDEKFHPPKSTLGDVISASYFFAALSTVFAGPLARHIGLVNTMVFTHIPSSAAVLLFPAAQSRWLTFVLLILRVGLNNMDQAPRAALIAAVVRPEERTAVMGITSTLRTLANVTGPSFTGLLADSGRFWIAFVVGGALRLFYDVGLFVAFINIQLYKHEPGQQASPGGSVGRPSEDAFEVGSDGDGDDRAEARLSLPSSKGVGALPSREREREQESA
ncbi:putative major facilitator superfamily transporter [Diaporthe ampelina]|uniref:Putative major facilitator superfamily transporter n=1 Tax=Diaporthe ampelina TaxID=1214573 RepID=A0A0G2FDC0_9PEZI|nr:putative major facilitator superfamily transporter [Diaporthe ampelina]